MIVENGESIYGHNKFVCPHCTVYSHHKWSEVVKNGFDNYYLSGGLAYGDLEESLNGFRTTSEIVISDCSQCEQSSIWRSGRLIFPFISLTPSPSNDMPEDVKEIFEEARKVHAVSHTAAIALLRLAVEKLLPQIGAKQSSIDKMIADLVQKGLPKEIEKALDSLRVIGNEAIHPGTIDLSDKPEVAIALFKILNVVVDRMITQQKEIDEIYSLIPENKLEAIKRRNMLNGEG